MKNASFVGNQCLITRILGLVKYKNYRRLYLFDASRCLHNVVVVGKDHEMRETLRRQKVFATFLHRRLEIPNDMSALVEADVGDLLLDAQEPLQLSQGHGGAAVGLGVAVENQVDFVPLHEVVVKQEELFLVDDLSRSILQNLFHLPTYLPTYKHTCLADGESVPWKCNKMSHYRPLYVYDIGLLKQHGNYQLQ